MGANRFCSSQSSIDTVGVITDPFWGGEPGGISCLKSGPRDALRVRDQEGTVVVAEDHMTISFGEFFGAVEPRLKQALVAAAGFEFGVEATAEALAYGWEHWQEMQTMQNPAGYLYRVGRTAARRLRRRPSQLPPAQSWSLPTVEPRLPEALSRLSEKQRTAVILIHSLEWTYAEAAELLGVSLGTVQKHVERGLRRLRAALGVEI